MSSRWGERSAIIPKARRENFHQYNGSYRGTGAADCMRSIGTAQLKSEEVMVLGDNMDVDICPGHDSAAITATWGFAGRRVGTGRTREEMVFLA